jgi:hypothetical protein
MKGDDKTYDVFISHAAKDSALAEEISIYCRQAGIEAFIADDSLVSGARRADVVW